MLTLHSNYGAKLFIAATEKSRAVSYYEFKLLVQHLPALRVRSLSLMFTNMDKRLRSLSLPKDRRETDIYP